MSTPSPRRKPITPTLVVIVGLLVGITGLLMLLLGIGVISPTVIQVPSINLNVQTATPGIVVMAIGFTVALIPIVLAMQVDAKRAMSPSALWDERRQGRVFTELAHSIADVREVMEVLRSDMPAGSDRDIVERRLQTVIARLERAVALVNGEPVDTYLGRVLHRRTAEGS